jgi:phosphotransferase system enzyme I (PtsP)
MVPSNKPTVHERGNARLDAVLDFVAFAAKSMPITTLLDEAPRRIATIFEADVSSLYLVEGDGAELVMRGNVGFSNSALGQVRLRVGEGITGEAVEYQRPISAETAEQHASYKYFAELHEERFPVFLAVPIRGKTGPVGALVVQRRAIPFEAKDIELLTALGAVIAGGIHHAELIDAHRARTPRQAGGGTRKVTLTGRPAHPGRVLGAIAALRRPPPRPTEESSAPASRVGDVRLLKGAFDVAARAIEGLREEARRLDMVAEAAFLVTYGEILGDMRFRERAMELTSAGGGIAQALSQVAREATRVAVSFTRDAFLEDRARDMEDLCDAITMLAFYDKRTALPNKAILIGDGVTVFDLLISSRAKPVAVALSERSGGPRTQALLRLLGVPAIVDVQGIFRWASEGDLALLDADHGILVINPSKSEMAALREHRRPPVRAD